MRIKCSSIDEFVACLTQLKINETLFGNSVRVSRSERERDSVSFHVVIQTSTVVLMGEGGAEYLLEAGEDCGLNFKDSGGRYDGNQKYEMLRGRIRDLCVQRGWEILPGVIDI